jgi:uncharacterized membrane protein
MRNPLAGTLLVTLFVGAASAALLPPLGRPAAGPVAPLPNVTRAAAAEAAPRRLTLFRGLRSPAPAEQQVGVPTPRIASPTLGQRVADRVVVAASTWRFLFALSAVTGGWMAAHSWLGDPELIKLNLGISITTMLLAPLVAMSQHREARRDRAQARALYQTGLETQAEVARLHTRIDQLTAALNAREAAHAAAPIAGAPRAARE